MTTNELVERLAAHRTIGAAPRTELEWIAKEGTLAHMAVGSVVSHPAEIVDGLKIILSGRLAIYADRSGVRQKLMEWSGGEVTGLLPYSRTLKPPGMTIVEEEGDVVSIDRALLPELIHHCSEVTAILVHVMVDRARRFTSTDLRDEKLISLGKLSAGIAHELNNPASAAMRDAKSMADALAVAEKASRTLGAARLSPEQVTVLDAVQKLCISSPTIAGRSPLDLADREDAIDQWLTKHGADPSLAPGLAATPVSMADLDGLARALKGEAFTAALGWIVGSCAARALAANIERAAARIHSLVMALKGFTHMDRAPVQESIEIGRGLSDTVALLDGKAKGKGVTIRLTVPQNLPPVWGISAEINQIWMNLIDNAIDAAPSNGHVDVAAGSGNSHLLVSVVDDGPGIPPEIREQIFEPFFTTKSVGEGTGLGLDIVRRTVQYHGGEVEIDSRPGRTEFRVRLRTVGKN